MGINDYLKGKDKNQRMRNRKANGSFSSQIKVNGGLEEEEDELHPLTVNAIYKREGSIMKKGPSSIKSKNSQKSGYKAVSGIDDTDHMGILDDLIKRMDQKNRIKELHDDLGILSEADEIEQERRNGTALTIKEKRMIMNEKRQKFEQHRHDKKMKLELAKAPNMSFGNDITAQQAAIETAKKDLGATGLFSQRSLSSSIKRKADKDKTHLEYYECRSDEEKERDQKEYKGFHTEFRENFRFAIKQGASRGVDNRRTKSFDNEIHREMYEGDSMAVASDFKSELSWVSYPPTG